MLFLIDAVLAVGAAVFFVWDERRRRRRRALLQYDIAGLEHELGIGMREWAGLEELVLFGVGR